MEKYKKCLDCGKAYCKIFPHKNIWNVDCPDEFTLMKNKKRSKGRNCANCLQKSNPCKLTNFTKGKACIFHFINIEEQIEETGGIISMFFKKN